MCSRTIFLSRQNTERPFKNFMMIHHSLKMNVLTIPRMALLGVVWPNKSSIDMKQWLKWNEFYKNNLEEAKVGSANQQKLDKIFKLKHYGLNSKVRQGGISLIPDVDQITMGERIGIILNFCNVIDHWSKFQTLNNVDFLSFLNCG